MENKKDKIDVFLNTLIKVGQLPPEDKIIEYLMSLPLEKDIPNTVKNKTIVRLEERQKELREAKRRLQIPEKLNSIGEYLRLLRIKGRSDTPDLSERAQIDPQKLSMLEKDRISPLDFTLDEMVRIIQSTDIGLQRAITLIRKSYQLFKIQPHLSKVSARYDDKHVIPESKIGDMDRALKELVLKSHGKKAEAVLDPELENYLKELQKALI